MKPLVSIVVPTLEAAETLPSCLRSVAGAPEIVVVDGGSSDRTRAIGRQHWAEVIASEPGRGVQLRAGADAARGEWLLFLHADTMLSAGWFEAVERHIRDGSDTAGYFRFRLQSRAWQARLVEAGVALRVRLLALPYGDQALLISRELYQQVGGYKPMPLLEDVDLVRRLGRRRLRRLDAQAATSPARWVRDGWWARSARNVACLLLYFAGVSPERVARMYGSANRLWEARQS